jgi:hypothetical protein
MPIRQRAVIVAMLLWRVKSKTSAIFLLNSRGLADRSKDSLFRLPSDPVERCPNPQARAEMPRAMPYAQRRQQRRNVSRKFSVRGCLSSASRTVVFPADACPITSNRRASFVFMKTSPLFVMGDMFIVPLRGDTLPVRPHKNASCLDTIP